MDTMEQDVIKPTTYPLTPEQIVAWNDLYADLQDVREHGQGKQMLMIMPDGMLLFLGGVQVANEQGFEVWVDVPTVGPGKVVLTYMGQDVVLPHNHLFQGVPPWDGGSQPV